MAPLSFSRGSTDANQTSTIWVGIGANIGGNWGAPRDTFDRVLAELGLCGFSMVVRSSLYLTPPFGRTGQPRFLNAVFGMRGSVAPSSLLRLVKRLEVRAGRRANGRWGPRPLDIDILDFGGRVIGRPAAARVPGGLVLPHPELAWRGFVLVPLVEVAPRWRHPRLNVSAETLLRHRPGLDRGIQQLGPWGGGDRALSALAPKVQFFDDHVPSGVDLPRHLI
ncbi:MAG: 2-amino-4-hydroxy-6-hydroxymethyldihydropteridine diphosphokinase [Hyphomicrobiaceae bacterium]